MLLVLSYVLLYDIVYDLLSSGCQSAQQYTLPHLNDQVRAKTNFNDFLSLHHLNKKENKSVCCSSQNPITYQ